MNNITKIIAFSGKKQSGKNTCANFIYSTFLAKLKIAKKININNNGQIQVSDLLNKLEYAGIFDPTLHKADDFIINQVFQKLDPHIKLYSFADALKTDICINILGMSYEQCYGTDKDKNQIVDCCWPDTGNPMTAREVMQYVGTDIFRKMKSDVWTSTLIRKIQIDNPSIAIITDCRFPNEVQCIQQNNGIVVRLVRDIYNSNHISETILDNNNYDWNNFNYIIHNENLDIYQQSLEIEKILQEVLP
jgi:hypothetical protein